MQDKNELVARADRDRVLRLGLGAEWQPSEDAQGDDAEGMVEGGEERSKLSSVLNATTNTNANPQQDSPPPCKTHRPDFCQPRSHTYTPSFQYIVNRVMIVEHQHEVVAHDPGFEKLSLVWMKLVSSSLVALAWTCATALNELGETQTRQQSLRRTKLKRNGNKHDRK
ncbi:hypothetical protein BDZ97DRAFT_1756892 [Flammula alnicola]|nr:hypothetical protein BDZ97DRAFT_1756892 [Flammula alnicola]